MRKLFGLMILALFLVVGCGKKAEPEAAPDAPGVSTTLDRLLIIRKEVSGTAEKPTFRGVLTVQNGYDTDITLERVEFSGKAGGHPMPAGTEQLDVTVPANGSAELRLDMQFGWKDDAPMSFERGTVEGTLYYRGPKGAVRSLPFSLQGPLTIRGE